MKVFMFIKWSHRSSESCRVWPNMTLISWARSPISFKHISCWCLFIDPHLTTYQCCVRINLGTSAWSSIVWPTVFTIIRQIICVACLGHQWGSRGGLYLVIQNEESLHDKCLPLANWAAVILFGWKELSDLLELSYQLKQSYDFAQENHITNESRLFIITVEPV